MGIGILCCIPSLVVLAINVNLEMNPHLSYHRRLRRLLQLLLTTRSVLMLHMPKNLNTAGQTAQVSRNIMEQDA
jgi:hypothetical protein